MTMRSTSSLKPSPATDSVTGSGPMDCGTGDFACYVDVIRIKLLAWSPALQDAASFLTDLFNSIIEAIKPHLHSLIALGSLSFAIWKWVRYREGALFARLKDRVAITVSGLRAG